MIHRILADILYLIRLEIQDIKEELIDTFSMEGVVIKGGLNMTTRAILVTDVAMPVVPQTFIAHYEYTPHIEYHKERDYPTLREGIRRKQVKDLRK